jgi:hypothetical protein
MDKLAILGQFTKAAGILIMVLPVILFFTGIYAGLVISLREFMTFAIVASIVFFIPCNFLGRALYKAGLSIEMEIKGAKSKEELRKAMQEIIEKDKAVKGKSSKNPPAKAKKPNRRKKAK